MRGIFLIPLYVEIITEKTELKTTTNNIPKSFNPISNIANGTHAILGKDCKPIAKELIVFPNPENFTIAKPITIPIIIEITNPIVNLYKVIPMLITSILFWNSSKNDSATIKGDGKEIFGHMPSKYVSCQIPIKAAINNTAFANSSKFTLVFFSKTLKRLSETLS